jgi:hypothetical protein
MTQDEINTNKLTEALARLIQARTKLLTQELSPVGVWIHEYTVCRKYPNGFIGEYRYAKWQADKPIFERNPKKRALPPKRDKDPKYTNHQHIGRVWSNTGLGMEPEAEQAYQSFNNRKHLQAIETALLEIQAILSRFELQ